MNGQKSGPACSPQCGSGGKVAELPIPTTTAKFPHPSVGEIDSGEEGGENLAIYGYREHCTKRAVTAALCLLTLGTLPLLLYWLPRLRLKFTAVRCGLETCDCVLVTDRGRLNEIQRVRMQCATGVGGLGKLLLVLPMRGGREAEVESFRYFLFRKLKYYWNPKERRFVTAREMTEGVSWAQRITESDHSIPLQTPLTHFHTRLQSRQASHGLSESEVARLQLTYGPNAMRIEITPLVKLLFKEALSPFYVFQALALILWAFFDDYVFYSALIALMSLVSITTELYQIRTQERRLRKMVDTSCAVPVMRQVAGGGEAMSDTLVPGDIIPLPPGGCVLRCDALLMSGDVVVNESMLTGESVPTVKSAAPVSATDSTLFSYRTHSKHVLYCGTHVLQTRCDSGGGGAVLAVVLRTGYSTLKGQLVRSIMFPKPVDFSFFADTMRIIGVLSLTGAVGVAYTVWVLTAHHLDAVEVVLRSLDIITIAVPPALPAVMSVGIIIARMRLRRKQIHCISPSTINTCGAVDVACFDKTGTLTEDGLDFNCALPVVEGVAGPEFGAELKKPDSLSSLTRAMASCHSLVRIDGRLTGDPMDLTLFDVSGWQHLGETELIQSPEGAQLTVLRQFPFSSELQRMSVLVRERDSDAGCGEEANLYCYCKGSPEIVASLSLPHTIPRNFHPTVERYARLGYRLIAIAHRRLGEEEEVTRNSRREAEKDLTLLGLVVMENRLKPASSEVVAHLNAANIRTLMITGDALLTAMSVAEECGILNAPELYLVELANHASTPSLVLNRKERRKQSLFHSQPLLSRRMDPEPVHAIQSLYPYQLAVSGPTLAFICRERPDLVDPLLACCDVYARMAPDQKQFVITRLQSLHYTVAMCGDGANDCAALKTAHVGVSISESTESSIAAPFTSARADISCVPLLIAEGRAALITSFSAFKYMTSYLLSLFTTVLTVFWVGSYLSEFQFLYQVGNYKFPTLKSAEVPLPGPHDHLRRALLRLDPCAGATRAGAAGQATPLRPGARLHLRAAGDHDRPPALLAPLHPHSRVVPPVRGAHRQDGVEQHREHVALPRRDVPAHRADVCALVRGRRDAPTGDLHQLAAVRVAAVSDGHLVYCAVRALGVAGQRDGDTHAGGNVG